MGKIYFSQVVLRYSSLGLLALSCIVLSAILSGVFPAHGDSRLFLLIFSALLTAFLLAIEIVGLTRGEPSGQAFFRLIPASVILLLSLIEYNYFTRKQDTLISDTISNIKKYAQDYYILSDIPEAEAISIIQNDENQKKLCGVSYFFGVFYLCAGTEHRTVVFILDIAPIPSTKKTIRVYVSPRSSE